MPSSLGEFPVAMDPDMEELAGPKEGGKELGKTDPCIWALGGGKLGLV